MNFMTRLTFDVNGLRHGIRRLPFSSPSLTEPLGRAGGGRGVPALRAPTSSGWPSSHF